MNRGVIAYIREGKRCAKNTFKNKMNYFKYYLMGLITLFGCIFIFTIPLVVIANIRLARLAERDEDIQIFKSFEKADNSKTFWTVFGFYFMYGIIFLAGLVLLGGVAGVMFLMGLLVGGTSTPGIIVGGILAAPFAILLLVFMVLYPFMLAPALYLYDCNTNLGLSGMLYNSVFAMRKTGKWTLFASGLITGLRMLLWLGILGGCVMLLIMYMDNTALRIVFSILTLAAFVLVLLRAPKILLSYQVAQVLLFNDICSSEKYISLAPSDEENTPKNVYAVSKRTLRAASKEQLLLGLFTRGTKLTDPEGVDQRKLPNEVETEKDIEENDEIISEIEDDSETSVYDPASRESSRYYRPTPEVVDLSGNKEETSEESKPDPEVLQEFLNVTEQIHQPDIEEVAEQVESAPVIEKEQEVIEEPIVEEAVEEPVIIDESIDLSEPAVLEPVEEALKPKRVRKPKAETVEPVAEEVVESPVVEEAPKPKRGRKPKVEEAQTTMENDINDLLDEILSEATLEANTEVAVEKPKRGRKPKTENNQ